MLRKIGQPSILYKPLQAGSKGPRELTFYESVFSQEVTSDDTIGLRQLIPAYYGTVVITDQANTPCILVVYCSLLCKCNYNNVVSLTIIK